MTRPLPGRGNPQSSRFAPLLCFAALFFFLCASTLLPGASAEAKIYKWVDENGTIHLKDYPASMYEENADGIDTASQSADRQQVREGEDLSGIGQQVSGIRSDAAQNLLENMQRGFRTADVDLLAGQFRFFEEISDPNQVREHRERIETLLSNFFDHFGSTDIFERGSRPADTTQLGRVISAYPDKWKNAGCEYSYFEFLAQLEKFSGVTVVRFSVCEADGKAWLSDLTLSLGNISPQLAEAARRFVAGEAPLAAGESVVAEAEQPDAGQAAATSGAQGQQQAEQERPVPTMRKQAPSQPEMQPMPDMPGMPDDFMQVIGLVSGPIIIIYTAIWLFFYFFFSLCLYLIARKLAVRAAWLAWIPIANIHTMVKAGGKSGWWTVFFFSIFIVSFLGPFFGMQEGGAFIGLLVLTLVVIYLVMFARIWMGICGRLGQNKWMGLLIYVPLANLVLPAVLAFKKEPGPPRYSIGRVLMWVGVAYVLLLVAIWALFTFVLMPLMMRGMSSMFEQTMSELETTMQQAEQRQAPPVPSGPPTAAAPSGLPEGVAPLTEADYDARLAGASMSYQGAEPSVSVGPAAFQYAHFWDNEESPHLWVKVKLAPVPNLDLFKSARLTVDHVWNSAGRNVYDPNSNFETEFFQELSFNAMDGPPPQLEAIRSVYLEPGVDEGDVSEIKGTLFVKLPIGVQAMAFTPKDQNQPMTAAGFTVTLLQFDEQEVQLQFQGPEERNLTVLAYDGQGKKVSRVSSSWWSSGETTKTVTYSFDGPVAQVKALLADAIVERRFPFTIRVE